MRLANLAQREQLLRPPLAWCNGLAVDPLGCIRVAPDFHVVAQVFLPDHAPLAEQNLDLAQHERVALERGGVVRLLVPDRSPDVLGLGRQRQTAQTSSELTYFEFKALVDRSARRSTSPLCRL